MQHLVKHYIILKINIYIHYYVSNYNISRALGANRAEATRC